MSKGPGKGSQGQRWWVQYRHRMDTGLEHCRAPGCRATTGLTFDHLHPRSAGGSLNLANATILCVHHQHAKGNRTDHPLCDLPSLAAEEAAAPPERQWSRQRVPDEVAHRIRPIRRRANRAAAATRSAEQPPPAWQNTDWQAQLAELELPRE